MLPHDTEELHYVAKVLGETNIERANILNSTNVDLVRINEEAMHDCPKQHCLVGCIPAVDIECLIRFGISQLLGLLEGSRIIEPRLGHPHQDIVGSSIDDS